MLYLGHFSFSQHWPSPDGEPWHALFTCVVEARNVDAAFGKFRRLIRELTRKHDAFDNVEAIYLDTCVELHDVPSAGLLSFISIRQGEDVGGITGALVGAKSGAAIAYEVGHEEPENPSDPIPMEPFMRLRRDKRPDQGKANRKLVRPSNQTVH